MKMKVPLLIISIIFAFNNSLGTNPAKDFSDFEFSLNSFQEDTFYEATFQNQTNTHYFTIYKGQTINISINKSLGFKCKFLYLLPQYLVISRDNVIHKIPLKDVSYIKTKRGVSKSISLGWLIVKRAFGSFLLLSSAGYTIGIIAAAFFFPEILFLLIPSLAIGYWGANLVFKKGARKKQNKANLDKDWIILEIENYNSQ